MIRSGMLSFSEAKRSVYAGDAYVTGFTLLEYADDDDDDDGDAWCSDWPHNQISVNVTAAWGGSWGCPNSGAYCESEVTTEASCVYDYRRHIYADMDDQDDIPQTAYDYINDRYHEYHDDDGYDSYAFDFDLDTNLSTATLYGVNPSKSSMETARFVKQGRIRG